tara:strand:+ start:11 stop:1198 length:1188 start_codon:yes stop_codon:yes gene_type:complete
MEENKETVGGFEVFSSPEELSASMNAEPQQTETMTEEAPQQESQVVSEPVQEQAAPQVESQPQEQIQEQQVEAQPEQVPNQAEQVSEQPQLETQEVENIQQSSSAEINYSDSQIEEAVMSYLSEKLERDVSSLDDLLTPQNPVDERVEAIANFVSETGRSPQEWFTYQSLNTSEMDDSTLVKVDMAIQYPNLTANEVNTLIQNKYKLDPNKFSEDEVKIGSLQMKVDAANAKKQIEEQRMRYAAPEPKQEAAEPETFINDEWISEMRKEANDLTGLEFDLGNNKTFTFGLDDRYKQELVNKNARLDEYFDSYVRDDGSWDFDTLNSHRAIVDNIDAIISSTYRQGLSDGQKNVVQNASNIQAQVPNQSTQNDNNPLEEQLKNIMGKGSNKLTFKI